MSGRFISISVTRLLEIVAASAERKVMLSTDSERFQRGVVDPTGNRYFID